MINKEAVKNSSVFFDMLASHSNIVDNINVEKRNNDQIANLNIQSYLETSVSAIKDSYENMGYTNIVESYKTVKIDGYEFLSLFVNCEVNGIQMRVVSIPIKCNGYLVSVTVFTYGNTDFDAILNKFYTIK